jgi:hypothetical protein
MFLRSPLEQEELNVEYNFGNTHNNIYNSILRQKMENVHPKSLL